MIDNASTLGAGGNVTLGNVVVSSIVINNTLSVTNFSTSGNITVGGTAAITGNTTVSGQLTVAGNIRTTGNVFAQNFFFADGSSLDSDIYDLDDLSNYTDGRNSVFTARYNQAALVLTNPFRIIVTINGVTQPGFIYNTDTVWFSMYLGADKGYTIDSAGRIKFADPPPAGSQVLARTQTGPTRAAKKTYPFIPANIMMGI